MICTKCDRDLPQRSGGFRTWACRSCFNQYNREIAARPEMKQRKSAYGKTYQRDRVAKSASIREYRARYPEKYKAHTLVNTAKVRGELVPQPCAKCGHEPAQAHHWDYSKPLDVIWLCRVCHIAEHQKVAA